MQVLSWAVGLCPNLITAAFSCFCMYKKKKKNVLCGWPGGSWLYLTSLADRLVSVFLLLHAM